MIEKMKRNVLRLINTEPWITGAIVDMTFNCGGLSEISVGVSGEAIIFSSRHHQSGTMDRTSDFIGAFDAIKRQFETKKFTGMVSVIVTVRKNIVSDVRISTETRFEK